MNGDDGVVVVVVGDDDAEGKEGDARDGVYETGEERGDDIEDKPEEGECVGEG